MASGQSPTRGHERRLLRTPPPTGLDPDHASGPPPPSESPTAYDSPAPLPGRPPKGSRTLGSVGAARRVSCRLTSGRLGTGLSHALGVTRHTPGFTVVTVHHHHSTRINPSRSRHVSYLWNGLPGLSWEALSLSAPKNLRLGLHTSQHPGPDGGGVSATFTFVPTDRSRANHHRLTLQLQPLAVVFGFGLAKAPTTARGERLGLQDQDAQALAVERPSLSRHKLHVTPPTPSLLQSWRSAASCTAPRY